LKPVEEKGRAPTVKNGSRMTKATGSVNTRPRHDAEQKRTDESKGFVSEKGRGRGYGRNLSKKGQGIASLYAIVHMIQRNGKWVKSETKKRD